MDGGEIRSDRGRREESGGMKRNASGECGEV